jgi:hypothetical protein
MTYVPAWAGFIFLANVLTVWSRRIVDWAVGEQMTTELVPAALNMALQRHRPCSVMHHSDQGSQFTSVALGERCQRMGARPSMGSVGDAYDSAMAESFCASLECDLIERCNWKSKTEARLALFTYIEGCYDRRHSALGYRASEAVERHHIETMRSPRPKRKHRFPTPPLATCIRLRRRAGRRRRRGPCAELHQHLRIKSQPVRDIGSSPNCSAAPDRYARRPTIRSLPVLPRDRRLHAAPEHGTSRSVPRRNSETAVSRFGCRAQWATDPEMALASLPAVAASGTNRSTMATNSAKSRANRAGSA